MVAATLGVTNVIEQIAQVRELNIEVLNGRSLLEFFFGSRNVGVGVQYNLLRSDFTKSVGPARANSACVLNLKTPTKGLWPNT